MPEHVEKICIEVYFSLGGKKPTRAKIRSLAAEHGFPESKIYKWFWEAQKNAKLVGAMADQI